MATLTKSQIAERESAQDALRSLLTVGQTVSTVLTHVSRSGMSRSIKLVIASGSEIDDITYHAALAMGDKIDRDRGGIKIGGCGMDMGFALVYNLSRTLFPNGHKCMGQGCPSNDHSNDYGEFSRAYNDAHAVNGDEFDWYIMSASSFSLSDRTSVGVIPTEARERRAEWQQAKSDAWESGESARWSRKRVHSDAGYALKQRWL